MLENSGWLTIRESDGEARAVDPDDRRRVLSRYGAFAWSSSAPIVRSGTTRRSDSGRRTKPCAR